MAIVNPSYEDFKNTQEHALDYREYRSTYDILRASALYYKVATQSEDYTDITNAIGSGLVTTAWHENTGNGEQLHIQVSRGLCIVDNQAVIFKDDYEFIYDLPAQTTTYDVYIRYKFIYEYNPNYAIIEIIQEPNSPDPHEYLLIGKVTVDPDAIDPTDPNSGVIVDLTPRSTLLADVHIIQSSNILGGSDNTIVYQTSADHTGFINAPTSAGQVLKWDGGAFVWEQITCVDSANFANCAQFLIGGDSNQIVYQCAPGTTEFINAPSSSDTYLKWDGSAFVWEAINITSVDYAVCADTLNGGDSNQILYQSAAGSTSFIPAPFNAGEFLSWDGSAFVWNNEIDHAVNLKGGDSNQIVYQSASDTTSFINAPSVSNTFLKWDGAGFVWDNKIALASSVEGGASNQILYQTSTNNTGFIDAPTDPDYYLKWDGSAFVWSPISVNETVYACYIKGGAAYQVLYQTGTDQTGFINAPTAANLFLKWDGSTFVWNNEIAYANDIKGGGNNQIVYQSAPDTTEFIVAPTVADTYLKWDGNSFVWDAVAGGGGSSTVAECALNLAGGSANQIPFQTNTDSTSFISAPSTSSYLYWNTSTSAFEWKTLSDESVNYASSAGSLNISGTCQLVFQDGTTSSLVAAPSTANSYLKWDGSAYVWETSSGSVTLAECANNLNNGSANQIPYQTGTASTSFIAAPSTANTFLKWDGSIFTWSSAISCAYNIVGGDSNRLVYQTGANSTGFIAAPTTSNTYLKWDGSAFVWSTVDSTAYADNAGTANVAYDIANGNANQIVYQTGSNNTGFISAPSTANTYLKWDGSAFVWDVVTDNVELAECANNLAGGSRNRIPVQSDTNITSFIDAPPVNDNASPSYLQYDSTTGNFVWTSANNSNTDTGVLSLYVNDSNNYRGITSKTTGAQKDTPENSDDFATVWSSTLSAAISGGAASDCGVGILGVGLKGVVGVGICKSDGSMKGIGVVGYGRNSTGIFGYSECKSALIARSNSTDCYAVIVCSYNNQGLTVEIDGDYGNAIKVASNGESTGLSVTTSASYHEAIYAHNFGTGNAIYASSSGHDAIYVYNGSNRAMYLQGNNADTTKKGILLVCNTNDTATDYTYAIRGEAYCNGVVGKAIKSDGNGFGVSGFVCCHAGVYGYACYGNYGAVIGYTPYAAAAMYGRHANDGAGVCGFTTSGSVSVSGNTAYTNTSDENYKFICDICIQCCLIDKGFPKYGKFTFTDEINKGFTEYIGPTAQSVEDIFDVYIDDIEYIVPYDMISNQKRPVEPTPPKGYEPSFRKEPEKFTLTQLQEFEKYEQELQTYNKQLAEYERKCTLYESNPTKFARKSMATVDGIALALASENFKCILDQNREIEQLKNVVANLQSQIDELKSQIDGGS